MNPQVLGCEEGTVLHQRPREAQSWRRWSSAFGLTRGPRGQAAAPRPVLLWSLTTGLRPEGPRPGDVPT